MTRISLERILLAVFIAGFWLHVMEVEHPDSAIIYARNAVLKGPHAWAELQGLLPSDYAFIGVHREYLQGEFAGYRKPGEA